MSTNSRDANETAPVCALGLDRATVAAWHDGALASGEAARIERHIATCPACRAQLADFERVEGIVRSERVPEPDARLWAAVRAGHAGRLRPVGARRPLLGGLGALAAVLLLALGFAQLFRVISAPPAATKTATAQASPTLTPSAIPSATPSATTVVPNPLTWTPITLPPGYDALNAPKFSQVVTPGGDNTAYACFFPHGNTNMPPQLWVTHSLGAQWTQSSLPAHGTATSCGMVVDALDANVVAVYLLPGLAPEPPAQFYASFNGGASWQALPANLRVLSLATYHGSTYVVTQNESGPSSTETQLQVSRDGLRTLHPIDAGITGQGGSPNAVWVKPDTGEVLALVLQGAHGRALYSSQDGGTSWVEYAGIAEGQLIVAPPRAGQPWRVCRFIDALPQLDCDLDGNPQGQFTAQPLPPVGGYAYLELTSGGTLLDAPSPGSSTAPELFTLAPGASAWSDRGPLPEAQLTDVPAPSGDLLWAFPGGGALDPQGRVFVARLQ